MVQAYFKFYKGYVEIDGKTYRFEQSLENNGGRISIDIYLDDEIKEKVVMDFDDGKITKDGEVIGSIEEIQ